MKKILYFLLLIGLLLFIPACAKDSGATKPDLIGSETTPTEKQEQIQYIITQNYGHSILLKKQLPYQKNANIIDGLLKTGAAIETSYGGSFISDINGLKSEQGGKAGERSDWFYFVNGIFADCGALDYLPQPGEIVWWDYHTWKTAQGTPAVIGCFPEPFLHGYRGQVKTTTILIGSAEMAEKGAQLQRSLQEAGVSAVVVREIADDLLKKREGPSLALGEWQELKKLSWFRELNAAYQRNGTYLHFTEKGLDLLDYKGNVASEIQGTAGVIMAIGEGNGDSSPLWIITGTDRSGTEAALAVLIHHPEDIWAAYSVVVVPDGTIKLPYMR